MKPDLHVVSLSGGKDSTAMLLMMLERNMPVDIILFCDTGLEFPAIYEHLNKIEAYTGRKITRIKAKQNFEDLLLYHPVKRKNTEKVAADLTGYSWPGPRQRWCTSKLKDIPREQFLRELKKDYNILEYVGLAADEQYRLQRKNNQKDNQVHPLIEWDVTEKEALAYCYDHGFDFGGLYDLFHRVSCWCCPLQSLKELRVLRENFPDLWHQLEDWESKTWRSFRADYSIHELNIRFDLEKAYLASGKKISGRDFFMELKWRLKENV